MDEWKPKKGERVAFKVSRFHEVHPSVPLTGVGVVVRKLPSRESCHYEVYCGPIAGDRCFYLAELRPCQPR